MSQKILRRKQNKISILQVPIVSIPWDGKVPWQLGAKEYQEVTSHKKPHTRDLSGGKKTRKAAASAGMRNSGKLNRIWGLYRGSWEGGGTLQSGAFLCGDWWDFMSRDWVFNSVGWGQRPEVRAVRVFCRCNLVVRSPQGRGLATGVA